MDDQSNDWYCQPRPGIEQTATGCRNGARYFEPLAPTLCGLDGMEDLRGSKNPVWLPLRNALQNAAKAGRTYPNSHSGIRPSIQILPHRFLAYVLEWDHSTKTHGRN